LIITRSPLRISLGGGGTDLPSYYNDHGGYLIAASINKYVYVNVIKPFSPGIYLKYSEIEHVNEVGEVKHPIIREALKDFILTEPQIEITSLADIPAGTGLGSSGSFTTALLKALSVHFGGNLHPHELAELACRIEIERLREPIGKQDQFISAYGGITEFIFKQNGNVQVEKLILSPETVHDLENNLLLFYTGKSRSASSILNDQNSRSINKDLRMIENLHYTKEIGLRSGIALRDGDTKLFGSLLNEHWLYKRSRSKEISSPKINKIYEIAINSGAIGGKLVGAGGGGFLMFYAKDADSLRNSMIDQNLQEVRFQFDFEGAKVIFSSCYP
jgi:D-glycero-alpha-D-manno-heptose-7-phosphate kinase